MRKYYPWLAVIPGLAVIVWMFWQSGGWTTLSCMRPSAWLIVGLLLAVVCFVLQNVSMSYRYHLLSGGQLRMWSALRVNILCEFASAVTPSAVGGSSFNFVFIRREGLSWGRSTFITLMSLFFDELFLVTSSLLVFILLPEHLLFGNLLHVRGGVRVLFMAVLAGLALWTAVLFLGIFVRPRAVPELFQPLFQIPFLRRRRRCFLRFAADLVSASREACRYGAGYWLKVFCNTLLSWCLRYGVAVCILFAFGARHGLWIAYAQQWVAWIVMSIMPTPGGSGFSEWLFQEYYTGYLPMPAIAVIAALAWRIIFYYSYLIAGVLCLPKMMETPRPSDRGADVAIDR